jgi:hypothetical protein
MKEGLILLRGGVVADGIREDKVKKVNASP